mmetsp:Transcript_7876/g.17645  ORF Transcript_7876/g.17645 Transcript_7876/m.17645 type:complete len:683 (-) Transcript_7876:196-2244(-)
MNGFEMSDTTRATGSKEAPSLLSPSSVRRQKMRRYLTPSSSSPVHAGPAVRLLPVPTVLLLLVVVSILFALSLCVDQFHFPVLVAVVEASSSSSSSSSPTPPAAAATILRIRLLDGSMTRIAVPRGSEDETTLSDVLSRAASSSATTGTTGTGTGTRTSTSGNDDGDGERGMLMPKIKIGQGPSQKDVSDDESRSKSISELGLKHGTLVTLVPPTGSRSGGMIKKTTTKPNKLPSATTTITGNDASSSVMSSDRFDPFPALAKPAAHSAAARRLRALSRSSRGTSYDQISKLREYMHNVEPQSEGSVKRAYMCTVSADRFKDGCTIKPTKKQIIAAKRAGTVDKLTNRIVNRWGLCLGTIGTERVDQKKDRVRTSLSTPLYEREMCEVAKVHAIWEPRQQGSGEGGYDASMATRFGTDAEYKRVVRIANALGLRPVGWIYSYSDNRHEEGEEDEDSLPVYSSDIYHGAVLQIGNMQNKERGRDEGKKFVTLALDANSGATEAFQLSDVSVQMVAEGLIPPPSAVGGSVVGEKQKKKKKKASKKDTGAATSSGRYVTTTEKFLIDSEETTELDSVLCLVNTALLGHTGTFCGKQAESSVNKKGLLTAKAKKNILAALEKNGSDDIELFEKLSDFNVLVALDGMIKKRDMDELCRLVRKWARGQRRGSEMGKELRLALKLALEM